jgi:hypothetical protein
LHPFGFAVSGQIAARSGFDAESEGGLVDSARIAAASKASNALASGQMTAPYCSVTTSTFVGELRLEDLSFDGGVGLESSDATTAFPSADVGGFCDREDPLPLGPELLIQTMNKKIATPATKRTLNELRRRPSLITSQYSESCSEVQTSVWYRLPAFHLTVTTPLPRSTE